MYHLKKGLYGWKLLNDFFPNIKLSQWIQWRGDIDIVVMMTALSFYMQSGYNEFSSLLNCCFSMWIIEKDLRRWIKYGFFICEMKHSKKMNWEQPNCCFMIVRRILDDNLEINIKRSIAICLFVVLMQYFSFRWGKFPSAGGYLSLITFCSFSLLQNKWLYLMFTTFLQHPKLVGLMPTNWNLILTTFDNWKLSYT